MEEQNVPQPAPLVTASYTIPADLKAMIDAEAEASDRNSSQVVREILRGWAKRRAFRPTATAARNRQVAA